MSHATISVNRVIINSVNISASGVAASGVAPVELYPVELRQWSYPTESRRAKCVHRLHIVRALNYPHAVRPLRLLPELLLTPPAVLYLPLRDLRCNPFLPIAQSNYYNTHIVHFIFIHMYCVHSTPFSCECAFHTKHIEFSTIKGNYSIFLALKNSTRLNAPTFLHLIKDAFAISFKIRFLVFKTLL